MLFFKNNEKGTHFLVDTVASTAYHVGSGEFGTLSRYKRFMSSWEIITLVDYNAVKQFQKIIKSGAYKGLDDSNLKERIINDYPELFI